MRNPAMTAGFLVMMITSLGLVVPAHADVTQAWTLFKTGQVNEFDPVTKKEKVDPKTNQPIPIADAYPLDKLGMSLSDPALAPAGCGEGWGWFLRKFNGDQKNPLAINLDQEPVFTQNSILPIDTSQTGGLAQFWRIDTEAMKNGKKLISGSQVKNGQSSSARLESLTKPEVVSGRYLLGAICVADTGKPSFQIKGVRTGADGRALGQWWVIDIVINDRSVTSTNYWKEAPKVTAWAPGLASPSGPTPGTATVVAPATTSTSPSSRSPAVSAPIPTPASSTNTSTKQASDVTSRSETSPTPSNGTVRSGAALAKTGGSDGPETTGQLMVGIVALIAGYYLILQLRKQPKKAQGL